MPLFQTHISRLFPRLRDFAASLSEAFYPTVCPVCHNKLIEGEDTICLSCLQKMPRYVDVPASPNCLTNRLWDTQVLIERSISFFYYKNENPYSRLIRDAKYNGRPEIVRGLARLFARELKMSLFFQGIDIIIPVPVHWFKQLKRGYNQSEHIAFGLSEISGLPVYASLRAAKSHSTQTHKSAVQRRQPLDDIFSVVNVEEIEGKHVLIVDDVITTGSTIISCARAIHKAAPTTRISVLSLACAYKN